jgi:hypothetical protein
VGAINGVDYFGVPNLKSYIVNLTLSLWCLFYKFNK